MSTGLRRAVAVLLIAALWVIAALGAFASLLSAYLGRVNWGDGQPPDPILLVAIAVLAIAVLALLAAGWVTRWVWRRV